MVLTKSWQFFLFIALPLRILNAVSTRTFFQPDEYWQSLEIAHNWVFGYGYNSWEWRNINSGGGIRSPVYPALFVPVYSLLKLTGLDTQGPWLVLAPKLVQAFIAASCDVSTVMLSAALFGPIFNNATFFCTLASFFNAYVSTRTFSNSAETALTTAALARWPWYGIKDEGMESSKNEKDALRPKPSLTTSLALAALATILRPSNAIIWITAGGALLFSTKSNGSRMRILATSGGLVLAAITLCFFIDTAFYGVPSLTPHAFLTQNVLNSISLFYGANPLHFYFSQGLPFTMMSQLPFFVHGFSVTFVGPRTLTNGPGLAGFIVGATLAAYSLLGHKEFRFIYPILPIFHCFAGVSLTTLAQRQFPLTRGPASIRTERRHRWINPTHALVVLLSLLPAIYLNYYHCVGQIEIMDILRRVDDSELKSVGFLVPCHSTPWQSHLHRRNLEEWSGEGWVSGEGGKVWFLTCEPPVLGQNPKTYKDQSDFFYDSPSQYLNTRFPSSVDLSFPASPLNRNLRLQSSNDLGWTHSWPSHIVLYSTLLRVEKEEEGLKVEEILRSQGYGLWRKVWNSHWHEDGRRRGDLLIWRHEAVGGDGWINPTK
ncbi:hypothetical protein T439DRAFT_302200 [Meredithblackwellia eburnea MCA 4105]